MGMFVGKNHLGFGNAVGDIWQLLMTALLKDGGKNGINNEGTDDDYFDK